MCFLITKRLRFQGKTTDKCTYIISNDSIKLVKKILKMKYKLFSVMNASYVPLTCFIVYNRHLKLLHRYDTEKYNNIGIYWLLNLTGLICKYWVSFRKA